MTTIKLDLDGVKTMRECREWSRDARTILDTLRLRVRACDWFLTRKGSHVIIRVTANLTDAEIVAAQAVLGSDRFREAANLTRVRRGIGAWNVMFSGKYMRYRYYTEAPCAKRSALMLQQFKMEGRWML